MENENVPLREKIADIKGKMDGMEGEFKVKAE